MNLRAELGLIDENKYNFLWVTEFPLLEWSDEEEQIYGNASSIHHAYGGGSGTRLRLNPGAVRAKAYDIVLNGTELGGGSVQYPSG